MKKRILALFLAAVLSLSLFSCSFGNEDEPAESLPDTSETVADTEETPAGGVTVIKKSEVSSFKLVYPRSIEDDAMVAVDKLVDKINSVCNVKLTVTNDFILAGDSTRCEWEHEILIGETNREESAAFGASYRPYDYGYGYLNGKIVIYGESASFLASAVNAFLLNVIMKNTKSDVFYQSDWSDFSSYYYAVPKLTVNGADVSSYEIIYPTDGNLFEKEMATRLQCYIVEMTGMELPIKQDNEARGTANAFLIGKVKGAESLTATALVGHEGCVSSNGTDIAVYGNTMTGVTNAAKHLTDLLFDSAKHGEERAVTVDGETKVEIPEDHYSTMTFNVYTSNQTRERKARVINSILRYLPDTVGLQEADPTWMNEFRMQLTSYYAIVGEGRDGGSKGEAVPILYAKERYDLIESGTRWLTDTPDEPSQMPGAEYVRNFTWALLEDKDTQARYLHLNVHLDTAGSEIRYAEVVMLMQFLQQYNDVAVIITGDMNAKIDSEEMKLLRSYKLATALDCPDTGFSQTNPIDWILMTSDCIEMTDYAVDDLLYDGAYSSDHWAFYSEFTLKLPENGRIDHNWDVEPSTYPEEWLGVSTDKVGAFYGPAQRVSAADRNENGRVEIPENAATVEMDGVTYVVIRSVEELNEALAADSARTNNYILAADLDYTGKTFQKIVLDQNIFDGNGYKMFGYELVDQDNGNGGGTGVSTFANASSNSNSVIRNLTIGAPDAHIQISSTFSGSSVGAVYGYSNATHTVENVTVYADITAAGLNAGGFAGNIKKALTLRDCKFYGSITDTVGGAIGGFVGKVNSLNFVAENCENYGAIQAVTYAGGFVGSSQGNSNVTMKNCFNYGEISVAKQAGGFLANLNYTGSLTLESCVNYGAVSGTTYLGGITGGFVGTLSSVTLTKCVNYGEITCTGRAGGLMGYVALNADAGKTLIDGCVNYGTVTGTSNTGGIIGGLEGTTPEVVLQNSANYGSVSGNSTAGMIGGLSINGPLTVNNCLNGGAVAGTSHTGGLVGYFRDCDTNVTNFASIGTVIGKWAGGIIGSTVPNVGTITLTNCAAIGSVTGSGRTSATIANQTGTAPVVSGLIGTFEDAKALTAIERATVTVEEALAWANTHLADTFGKFLLDSDGTTVGVATPGFVGIQQAVGEEGELRLVGSILGNSLRYHAVGFEIVKGDGTTVRVETEKLHRQLSSSNGGEGTVMTPAAALGGTFVYAVEVEGLIPAEGTVTVTVTACATDLDGETLYRGATYLVTFTDGDFVSAVVDAQ